MSSLYAQDFNLLDRILAMRNGPRAPPTLIVLCGPSHSGKSTFAKRLQGPFTVISSDVIRRELTGCPAPAKREETVWRVFDSLKREALSCGDNVVLDACHMSKAARRHSLQGQNAHHRKICVVFDLPLRTIRARCLKGNRLPVEEAERVWRAFQHHKPTRRQLKEEGFDEVYFVTVGSGPRTAEQAPSAHHGNVW